VRSAFKPSAAPLLLPPALILWIAWDVAIAFALVVTSIPLLFAAAVIACAASRQESDRR
jgi:hypothetical protein